MMYYFDMDYYNNSNSLFLFPGDRTDMAKILARLTLLLIGTDACTRHTIDLVWGQDKECWVYVVQTVPYG